MARLDPARCAHCGQFLPEKRLLVWTGTRRRAISWSDVSALRCESKYVAVHTPTQMVGYVTDSLKNIMDAHPGRFVLVRRGLAVARGHASELRRVGHNAAGSSVFELAVAGLSKPVRVSRRVPLREIIREAMQ